MRMNKTASSALSIMALFAASMATSCSSDSLSEDGNTDSGKGKTVTLTAKVNESDATTRMGMSKETDDAASFYWHSDDAILVQTVSGSTYSGAEFTTETATGEASAEFTGTVESGNSLGTYAVYPYSDKHKFASATALTYNLPATYTYNKVESGIFSKTDGTNTTYRSTSTNIPMVGTINGESIDFKHIGGLVVIRIDKMFDKEGILTVTADQQLCGDFTIGDLSADGAAIVTSTTAATTDNKTVKITFSGATEDSVGVFYLPLATGSYSGLKIEINYGYAKQTVNYGNLYVARGSVNAIPLYTIFRALGKWSESGSGGTYTLNGQKFVDLGLSVLWATCNVGASTSTEDGNYYAWGEVETKTSYMSIGYKYGINLQNFTKYNTADGLKTLEAEDDAATRNWGSGCRMPTYAEIGELMNTDNCTWTWTTVSGVNGYKVTSKKTGYTNRSIFLPASGRFSHSMLYSHNIKGRYRSSSLMNSDSDFTHILYFWDENTQFLTEYRTDGETVRPVAEK